MGDCSFLLHVFECPLKWCLVVTWLVPCETAEGERETQRETERERTDWQQQIQCLAMWNTRVNAGILCGKTRLRQSQTPLRGTEHREREADRQKREQVRGRERERLCVCVRPCVRWIMLLNTLLLSFRAWGKFNTSVMNQTNIKEIYFYDSLNVCMHAQCMCVCA